jgi:serine protease AprX
MKRTQCLATWRKVFLMASVLILSTTLAFAGSSKMAKDLENRNAADTVAVIVQFKQAPTAAHHQKVLSRGGSLKQELSLVKGGAYSMPASKLAELAADPDVAYIAPDRPVQTAGWTDGFVAVNADIAQSYGYTGKGIGVAVIDSGIYSSHPDISGHVVYSQDFTGEGKTTDLYGHGSHVAGIIGGSGNGSTCTGCFLTYKGIAQNVNLINLRVLNSSGIGTDSSVIAAIQKAISLKSTYNIRVINLSLGRGIYESYKTDPLTQAVEQAWKAGIVVVVAAGNYGRDNSNNNNGYGTITSPGNDPYAITVGAMRTMGTQTRVDDAIASYSSKGPSMLDHVIKPDLVAPGNQVSSLLAPNDFLYTNYPVTQLPLTAYMTTSSTAKSTSYFTLSGTSMAAPMVSGAAALMLEKNPSLTPDQVKARLMKTSFKNLPQYTTAVDPQSCATYNEQADIFTIGAGYLDIAAALNNADSASSAVGVAMSPTASYNASTDQVTVVNGSSVLWGGSVLWGTSVVWGGSVIWGTNSSGQSVLWGSSVVWGSSTNSGFSVLWGASTSPMSVLWGSSSKTSDGTAVTAAGDVASCTPATGGGIVWGN